MKKAGLIFLCSLFTTVCLPQTDEVAISANTDPLCDLTVEQYNQKVKVHNKLVLVYFKAGWCRVCLRQEPVLHDVQKEYSTKIDLLELDMDCNPLVSDYFEVGGLPILILYKNGKIVWDRLGIAQKKEIAEQIKCYE